MDVLTVAQRSYNMSMIRGSNTTPELKLKKTLKTSGFTYQPKGVYGRPDFVNRKKKVAVFIDGCFWHGCKLHYNEPKSNITFWKSKLKRNLERDRKVNSELKEEGFKVIRIWEHDINGRRN